MDDKKFKMIDESFECIVCKKEVKNLGYTARDHCPYCLCSMHVDINPGDRKETCHGVLRPIAIENYKDTYKIVYKCDKCGMIKKNIAARDDNIDKIIEISKSSINYEY